jgi:hypothetical protein
MVEEAPSPLSSVSNFPGRRTSRGARGALVFSALQLASMIRPALPPRFPVIECHYLQGGLL